MSFICWSFTQRVTTTIKLDKYFNINFKALEKRKKESEFLRIVQICLDSTVKNIF